MPQEKEKTMAQRREVKAAGENGGLVKTNSRQPLAHLQPKQNRANAIEAGTTHLKAEVNKKPHPAALKRVNIATNPPVAGEKESRDSDKTMNRPPTPHPSKRKMLPPTRKPLRDTHPQPSVVQPAQPPQTTPLPQTQHPLAPKNLFPGQQDETIPQNPFYCSTYADEIFTHLHKMERQLHPDPCHLAKQKGITRGMRAVLMDWLLSVHHKFEMQSETLFLMASIIDRFLGVQQVAKDKYQLVGVTGLLIASKYEEVECPSVEDITYITDSSYSKEEVLKMELDMLQALGYSLGAPTPVHFLRRYSRLAEVGIKVYTMAKFLCELGLTDYKLLHFYPSQVAAASLLMAMKLLGNHTDKTIIPWSFGLQQRSGYSEDKDIRPCLTRLAQLVLQVNSPEAKQKGVLVKYGSKQFHCVSKEVCLRGRAIRQWAAQDILC